MSKQDTKLIVVLGMHRSGTSAITRGLEVMGVGLGDNLMAAVENNNNKGFWEDVEIVAFNDEILHSLALSWHSLTSIDPRQVKLLHDNGYFNRAIKLIKKKLANQKVYGFKDPRVARLLLFWSEVFDHCQLNVFYVIAVRHPLSVAISLEKRDQMVIEKGYFLWLSYVLSSLKSSQGSRRVVVDYDRLIKNPENELARIANGADLNIDTVQLQHYKMNFLDNDLRHTEYQVADLTSDDKCPPMVAAVYAELLNVAADKVGMNDASFVESHEAWSEEFEGYKRLLNLTDIYSTYYEMAIVNAKQLIMEKDLVINQKNSELDQKNSELDQIYTSGSWKLTRPLRSLKNRIHILKVKLNL